MPIVKMSWVKTPKALETYLMKDRDAETVETSSHALEGHMTEYITKEHERYGDNSKNVAVEIIQSWTKEESKLFSPQQFNEMGQELSRRIAPGHMAWVVTHTEKQHIHNHIVICAVNSEDGRRLQNKRSFLLNMRDVNNNIARENGLSVLKPRVQSREANLPQNVKSMVARGKKSWMFDMIQKADFARAASTNFDEYVSVLKTLGVDVRVENKNISYFYGDHTKGIRGKKLGTNFGKDGLVKAFKENDERFAKKPGIRERIRGDLAAAFDGKGNRLGTPSHLLLESASYPGLGTKDYGRFTKIDRGDTRKRLPAIFDEHGGILYPEMKRAMQVSIFDYCKQHGIQLKTNEKGQTVLRGREFVSVTESGWKNAKNHTKGTIIDFVALHDETDYLRAVAKINRNPRLLLFESVMGEHKRNFQSFYIPKAEAASPKDAAKTLTRFLQSRGTPIHHVETLLKSRNVHIGKNDSVWLFGEKNQSALEFSEAPDGRWKGKRHGDPKGGLFESVGKSKKAVIYSDPVDYLIAGKIGASSPGGDSTFVMLDEGSHGRLDELLALNTHISEVHFAASSNPADRQKHQQLFHDAAKRFNPFDIKVIEFSPHGLSKDRGRGPDIGI